MRNTKNIQPKIRNKAKCAFSALLFSIVLVTLAKAIRQEKEVKGIHRGKEKLKLSLFISNMVLCIEDPKNTTKKISELITNFNNVADIRSTLKSL